MINGTHQRHHSKADRIISDYGIERLIIASIINCVIGLAITVGLKSLGIQIVAAISLAILSAIAGVLLLTKRLPVELVGIRKQKPWLSTLWLLIAFIGVLQIARLSVFMIDPSQTQHSLFPGDQWMIEHCCLTAYSESAKFVDEGEKNIYKPELYRGAEFLVNKEFRRKLDTFPVDPYHYPPPFL